MESNPRRWHRLVAALRGEVPAAEVDAFRRGSRLVAELLEDVKQRRLECGIDALDPWTVPPATRAMFLCAWNAFVLQALGTSLLDADDRADPGTPHSVTPAIAEQALRFFIPVEGWVSRASQAQANPDYQLDVSVPVPLPAWAQADPVPAAHLDGLLQAIRQMTGALAPAMDFVSATPADDPARQEQAHRWRQLHAHALARARFAEEQAASGTPRVRAHAVRQAQTAAEQLALLGQLVSDPGLSLDAAYSADLMMARAAAETSGGVEFIDFAADVLYELSLKPGPTRRGPAAVLRMVAYHAPEHPHPLLATVIVRAEGEPTLLHASEAPSRRASGNRTRAGFAVSAGMLKTLCDAPRVGLSIVDYSRTIEVDPAAVERFQAYCRAFRDTLPGAAARRAGAPPAPDPRAS